MPESSKKLSAVTAIRRMDGRYRTAINAGNWQKAEQLIHQAAEMACPDIFDNKNGIGQGDAIIDPARPRFVKWMTPGEFRSLVPRGVSDATTRAFIVDGLKHEILTISPPVLIARWYDDEEDGHWDIVGLDGRSRADAFHDLHGDKPIPVEVFPVGEMQAKDLTVRHRSAPYVSKKSGKLIEVQTSKVGLCNDQGQLILLSERFPPEMQQDDLSILLDLPDAPAKAAPLRS